MLDFQMQSAENDETLRRPRVKVAVVMRRERIDNAWQPWRWTLADVVPNLAGFGERPPADGVGGRGGPAHRRFDGRVPISSRRTSAAGSAL